MTNGDYVNGRISDKNIKNHCSRKRFYTYTNKKTYSFRSNINICCFIKFQIPIFHRKFFRILSQSPD